MTVNSNNICHDDWENHNEEDNFAEPDVLCLSSESDVVVDELAPSNEEDCHRMVVEPFVLGKIITSLFM